MMMIWMRVKRKNSMDGIECEEEYYLDCFVFQNKNIYLDFIAIPCLKTMQIL